MTSPRDAIIETLRTAKPLLDAKYGVRSLALFGSFARGDFRADSDVDVMVDFSRPIGMEIVDLCLEIERLLGKKVDLVSAKAIKPRMLPYIEKDLIYV